ncbi:MAG: Gfo/Idh/MocA family protein [Thermoplasmatota archaeon]
MRFGIIGIGRHGLRYAKHLVNDVSSGELVSVSGRMNRDFSGWIEGDGAAVNFFSDHIEMLEGDIDSVVVVTPTGTHHGYVLDALERGKHVLVEKPMAGSTSECMEMMDRAEESGKKLMVSHTLRYNKTVDRLRQIYSGLGDVREIQMEQHLEPPDRKWLFDRSMARGGVLLNTGVHIFDSLRFITGSEIEPLSCSVFNIENPHLEDLAYGKLLIGGSVDGSFCVSRFFRSRGRVIRIRSDSCEIFGDAMNHMIIGSGDQGGIERVEGEKRALIPLLEDFINVIKYDLSPSIGGDAGMKAVEAAQRCYEISSGG